MRNGAGQSNRFLMAGTRLLRRLCLSGCETTIGLAEGSPIPPIPATDTVIARFLGRCEQPISPSCPHLANGDPATQAEIFADAQSAATLTPGTSSRLRYALILGDVWPCRDAIRGRVSPASSARIACPSGNDDDIARSGTCDECFLNNMPRRSIVLDYGGQSGYESANMLVRRRPRKQLLHSVSLANRGRESSIACSRWRMPKPNLKQLRRSNVRFANNPGENEPQ